MHPGISDNILIQTPLKEGLFHKKIRKYFSDLEICNCRDQMEKRQEVLQKLMQCIASHSIITFEDYLWHCNITCRIFLLQNMSIDSNIERNKLLSHTFQLDDEEWTVCPIRVHVIAKNLYEFLQDDFNLIYVVKHFINFNELTYHIGLCLIWAGIFRFMNKEIKMFRKYELSVLKTIIETYVPSIACEDVSKLQQFLYLISLLQNTTILRNKDVGDTMNDIFLLNWLRKVKNIVDGKKIRTQKIEYLDVCELLILDIINMFNDNDKE